MAKESVAERLARLKAESEYDLAPELRYCAPDDGLVPEPEPEIAPVEVEALRLESPDRALEYQWIVNCRKRGIVPAIKILRQDCTILYVYPKDDRRYTVAARVEFRAKRIAIDGLVATCTRACSEDAEELLNYMVDVASRDATPERWEKACATNPQDWLHELKGRGGEWLSVSSDNLPEGPVENGWSECKFYGLDVLCQRDRDVYHAYLVGEDFVKIVPRSSVSERLTAYRTWPGEQYRAYRQRNRFPLSLNCSELENHIAGKSWTGWDNFHARWPDAPGILALSAVGYSGDFQNAFFTAFNRCDPRLLVSSNARAGTLEYLERVWLESTPGGWRVKEKVRLHARPIDAGPIGALNSVGSVRPSVTRRLVEFEDMKVDVDCEGPEELAIGFNDGRPVAFFTIVRENEAAAIAAIIGESRERTYEPPEVQFVDRLSFQLDKRDFVAIENESILKEALMTDSVVVSVFVWMDGDWRRGNAVLEPDEFQSEVCDYSPVEHPPHVLDWLYQARGFYRG